MCKEYSGWTNYPTWAVALWWGNSEGDQTYWEERATALLLDNERDEGDAASDLADEMRDVIDQDAEEIMPSSGMYADIWGWALEMVEWREIAKHYISEAALSLPPAEEEEEEV